jgi:predicted TIM-barrel fold metal-dependent hydrolase
VSIHIPSQSLSSAFGTVSFERRNFNMRPTLLTTLLALAIEVSTSPTPLSPPRSIYLPKRLIALEEHFVSPSLLNEVLASGVVQRSAPGILEKLTDVGAGRIAAMDAGHLSLQVLGQQSASGLDDVQGCRDANDAVKEAVDANKQRFAGFAVLPMADPEAAALELKRAVEELGFKGAMIWNHLKDGTYYDALRFDPVFAMAQKHDIPIYLHPAAPSAEMAKQLYAGNYPASTVGRLGTNSWGWHVDVGLHILRLYSAGLFDRYPKLKMIIGHNGEDLPMFIDRIDSTGLRNGTTFDKVWNTNIWSTTSAFFTVRAFQQLRQVSPIERIMYSVDYPFSSMTDGWEFVEKLAESKVLNNEEMDLFAYKNAEHLLKL